MPPPSCVRQLLETNLKHFKLAVARVEMCTIRLIVITTQAQALIATQAMWQAFLGLRSQKMRQGITVSQALADRQMLLKRV
jgi:hypothetical protein